jgi:hypothetical protein
MTEILDKLGKLKQRLEDKFLGRSRHPTRRGRIPISPLASNSNAAARGFAQDQRLGPGDTPGFKDGETLAFLGMEGVADLSPS